MSHKILFLHFGGQCPWIPWAEEQCRQAAVELNAEFTTIDVTFQPELAAQYRMLSSMLTVIDDHICLPAPTLAKRLVSWAEKPQKTGCVKFQPWQPQRIAEQIVPFNPRRLVEACALCNMVPSTQGLEIKQAWINSIMDHHPGETGLCAIHHDQVVSVVEYLPADLIPYALPKKSNQAAFITCLYAQSDSDQPLYDCRGQLLDALADNLRGKYRSLLVISGENTAYPNGPRGLFTAHGFQTLQALDEIILSDGIERCLLMERILPPG